VINSTDAEQQPAGDSAFPGLAWRWAINLAYGGVLIVLAVMPSDTVAGAWVPPDWAAHAAAYGMQTALLSWALRPSFGARRAVAAGMAGAVLFGLATESLQLLQPSRSVELRDVAANAAGAAAVWCVLTVASRCSGGWS